jgi:hypothetical protein
VSGTCSTYSIRRFTVVFQPVTFNGSPVVALGGRLLVLEDARHERPHLAIRVRQAAAQRHLRARQGHARLVRLPRS